MDMLFHTIAYTRDRSNQEAEYNYGLALD